MNSRERTMLIVAILLVILLVFKSLYLDNIGKLTKEEESFKKYVELIVQEEYNGKLQGMNILTYKVYNIDKLSDKKTIIKYYDEESKKTIEKELNGEYIAKVRGYFLKIFPYTQFKIKSKN